MGIVGLGIIGQRVADNLRRKQFRVFVWNRTPKPVPNFVGAPREIAQLCDIIQIFVADDEALRSCIQQLSPGLTAHHIVMAHSTVAPETMRAAAEMVNRRGARFLDAPFTGSKLAAEKGELVYYVGGDETALEEATRVLEASSKAILAVGKIGDATTLKIATNLITAATVQSAVEALALVSWAGLSPEIFALALEHNGSNSGTLALKLPKIISGDFEPHFSVKHMLKDMQIASRMARALDLKLVLAEGTEDALLEEMSRGAGDQDYSSVARRYFPAGVPMASPEPEVHLETELPFGEAERVEIASEDSSPGDAADPEANPIEMAILPDEQPLFTTPSDEPVPAQDSPEKSAEPEAPRGFLGRLLKRGRDE